MVDEYTWVNLVLPVFRYSKRLKAGVDIENKGIKVFLVCFSCKANIHLLNKIEKVLGSIIKKTNLLIIL